MAMGCRSLQTFQVYYMNKIVIYLAGIIFLLGVLLRIFFALFFPDKFAEGARKVLFIDAREKKLFRSTKKQLKYDKKDKGSRS